MTPSKLELAANAFNAASIGLAGRNNMHTWWTGICGCALFAWVFFQAHLYADVTLQGFFIVSGLAGFARWRRGTAAGSSVRPITRTANRQRLAFMMTTLLGASSYALLLKRYTNAALPFADSLVLGFSVLGQLLLVARRIENWWCWILVNSIATPLYAARGLYVTAALYLGFWVNAWIALAHWRRELGLQSSLTRDAGSP
jgi:nicotinamide mononucleotide transporter